MHHEMRQGIIVLGYNLALPRYKDSAKFRFSEENTNKFAFLSVRKLSKSSEKTKFYLDFSEPMEQRAPSCSHVWPSRDRGRLSHMQPIFDLFWRSKIMKK